MSSEKVYALGKIGTDFSTKILQDSFTKAIPPNSSLLDYLHANPREAQSVIWTLNVRDTPIYVIGLAEFVASFNYDKLCSFLIDSENKKVSIPGYLKGTVRLMSGQVVPTLIPEVQGMRTISDLVTSVMPLLDSSAGVTKAQVRSLIEDYLNIYDNYANLGVTPQERALNFSATHALQASEAVAREVGNGQVMDEISVEKNPLLHRPDSDFYDVKLTFCDPANNQRSNRVYRLTVDVGEVMPVMVGKVISRLVK